MRIVFALLAVLALSPHTLAQPAPSAAIEGDIAADLSELVALIRATTSDQAIIDEATELEEQARAAAAIGNKALAIDATEALEALANELVLSFDVTVVSRPDELSGVFRVPDANPEIRNYYLIVEAIDDDGNVLRRTITSEEDNATRDVAMWGVRVPQAVYDRVAADKTDDGIIQNDVIGAKERGDLEISWTVETLGGAILDW